MTPRRVATSTIALARGYSGVVSATPYRAPGPKPAAPLPPPDPYLRAWRKLRALRLLALASTALVVAAMLTCRGGPFLAAGGVWLLCGTLVSYFACPRCAGRFCIPGGPWVWVGDFFRRRCPHCGLAVGTRQDAPPKTASKR